MEYSVEVVSPVQRKISVTIPADAVNATIDAEVRNYGRNLTLDGFRKGKVPPSVIEKRFGGEIIARATGNLINREVEDILQKEKLRPVNRLQFDGEDVARDTEYAFAFSFEVLPDTITVPEDLASLSVEIESAELSEAEAEAMLLQVRRSMATLKPVEEIRTPRDGDVLVIDVEMTVDGVAVPGVNSQNRLMQWHDPKEGEEEDPINAVVRTMKPGEEQQGSMTMPDDHIDPNLRGKEALFTVKLHALNEEVLPDFDDDMAKKYGFEAVDQLRKAVLDQATNAKIRDIRNKGQEKLLESLIDTQDYPLPESMVSAQLNENLADARNFMVQRGMDSKTISSALEDMRDDSLERAKKQAKAQAFLMAVGVHEGIVVGQQDVGNYVMRVAQETKQDPAKLYDVMARNGMLDGVEDRILASKALDLMYGKAKKVVIGADGKPLAPVELRADTDKKEEPKAD